VARSEDSIESRNKAIVMASFDAWASGAGSPYDLLADDASWSIVGHSVASKIYPSKEAFLPRSSARSTPG
jgi:ketosteroid isomerase-like protein